MQVSTIFTIITISYFFDCEYSPHAYSKQKKVLLEKTKDHTMVQVVEDSARFHVRMADSHFQPDTDHKKSKEIQH